ncbi:MAG: hypothetical protein Q4D04_05130, partial [Clostridia bacterium]|nr:hypothetical protein [Clostridia bacterium]
MNEIVKGETFIGYEYLKRTVPEGQASRYIDCFRCFGWQVDENVPRESHPGYVTLSMKRDRKLINRTELTRLQRSFEDCAHQLDALERSKTNTGTVWALVAGLTGTAFI